MTQSIAAAVLAAGSCLLCGPAIAQFNQFFFFAGAARRRQLIGFASINATAGKDDGNYQAVTVGVRLPL